MNRTVIMAMLISAGAACSASAQVLNELDIYQATGATSGRLGTAVSTNNGLLIATNSINHGVSIFDIDTGDQVSTLTVLDPPPDTTSFGTDVDSHGDHVVVATHSDGVYVFDISDPLNPFETTRVLPDESQGRDIGRLVAIGDGVAAIQMHQRDPDLGTILFSGVLLFDPVTGEDITIISPPNGSFPASIQKDDDVAIDGSLLAIGYNRDDTRGHKTGAVYVYDIADPHNPIFVTKCTSPSTDFDEHLGTRVEIHGNKVIAGAERGTLPGGQSDSGGAVVFNATTGVQLALLVHDDSGLGDAAGSSVAIQGNVALVGVPYSTQGFNNAGSAYFFDARNGTQLSKLVPSASQGGARFGQSVAFDDSGRAFVGAPDKNPAGAVYSFAMAPTLDCPADVNDDGLLTPTDFTAWINAFNNNLPACDQNGDGGCTATDFTAWIANFNAGC